MHEEDRMSGTPPAQAGRRTVTVALVSALLSLVVLVAASPVAARQGTLRLEVAEVGSRFRLDEEHRDENGLATRGNVFLVEGYVYPAGTLTCDGLACNGVTYDAAGTPAPEFPDRVMGTWVCYGTHLEDAATPQAGPLSVTTQVLDLGEESGETTIVTTGFERGQPGLRTARAITGGTGRYLAATGEQHQTLLGFNNIDLFHEGQSWAGITLSLELSMPKGQVGE
jgi:hypothetical protein